MRRRTGWVIPGVAAVVVAALVVAFVVVQQRRETARARDAAAAAAAQAVADAWAAGDLTGAPVAGDAAAVQAAYDEVVAGLGGVAPTVEVGAVQRTDDVASTELTVTWPFGDGWTYTTPLELTGDLEAGDGGTWAAAFDATTVHPDLAEGDRLTAQRVRAERAEILGRGGTPIVTSQPVVDVGVQPSRVEDVAALTAALAEALEVDGPALAERIAAASPEAFVPVITLRRADYDAVSAQIQPLAGTVFRESQLPLAPTREFARALLGTVGPVTAEIVEASGGRLAAGDVAGVSGLQRQYDERLGGTAGVTVARVRGEETTELFTVEPVPGEPVQMTLDVAVQQAADAALATATGGNGNAALVAVDVPSGEVLAVANTPVSGANRALTGQYPPGSTFKTVSTLALLGTGLTPDQVVPCPPTATVDGRSFRNFEGNAAGDVPFRVDFAESCNTAFVALSQGLEPGALTEAAASVGIGVDWQVGVDAFTGSVPTEEGATELAAATIGQGRVLASPLAMAQAAATFARGSWVAPSLVTRPAPEAAPAQAPAADPERLATVSDLMREVATSGTASALADAPGQPVHAKTGTAEYGTEDPPRTHAWTIGFSGDVAFAVLVEDGASGGAVAVPVAEAFLRGLA
ncbi:MAG: penicillin-binding transpeptidase domain-containing protein [Actinomycetes bacterium]